MALQGVMERPGFREVKHPAQHDTISTQICVTEKKTMFLTTVFSYFYYFYISEARSHTVAQVDVKLTM